MALPHWLRDCIQVADVEQPADDNANVLDFPRRRVDCQANDNGQSALDLVYQAAELVGNLQEESRQTEARAKNLCRSAAERLRHAEQRAVAAESALSHAESRLSSAEARLCDADLRARNAEMRAHELDQALSRIEEAIRTRLLGKHQHPNDYRSAAFARA
jgi:chromosome segregation ATPase